MKNLHEAMMLLEDIMITANEKITRELDAETLHGLSFEQYDVLAFLKLKGDKTPGEIAMFKNVTKSAMSNRLSKLLAQGYITYMPAPAGDKRSKHVHLTKEGLKVATDIQQRYQAVIAEMFEDLQENEDLTTFIRILKIVQGRLKK